MVFYRKYRPQKIAELDSESVRNSLYSIFAKKDSVPHAFLFSGPKGLGKTSAARIVAKVINCEKHGLKSKLEEKEIEPCNKCQECVSITNGTNLDVLEIDGASNRGIDEIRDLKEKINLLPTKAFKKVYIIDEVHMLTTEAFNALLKTLEEPPNHAVFILCTTELHKVPQTIVSRCFRVDFIKASNDEIARSLKRVVKAEEIKIDNDVILEIAKLAEGSLRDGVKILEEIYLSAGKKTITKQILEEKYNTQGIDKSLEDLINVLKIKDAKKGFEITQKLFDQGMDFKFFLEKLMGRFHFMLLTKLGVSKEFESEFEVLEIKEILELLSKAYIETKSAVLPQLPLELAIVEWVNKDQSIDSYAGERPHVARDARLNLSQALPDTRSLSENLSKSEDENTTIKKAVFGSLANGSSSVIASSKNIQSSESFYTDFINEVKSQNHLIAGVLRSCTIDNSDGNSLQIFAISKFHKEKLEEAKSMLILEEAANSLLGKKLLISVTLRG